MIPSPTTSAKPVTPPANAAPAATVSGGPTMQEKVERILNLIRPAVQSDGGDLELVGITPEGIVNIRLHGACVGCPSSSVTLQMGIERNLRDHVPEVKAVRAVD